MKFERFLKKLAKETGKVSIKKGIVTFKDGKTFNLGETLKAKKAFAIIQEGGSSTELYLHAHSSREEAEQDRVSCAQGSYRTSRIIEIPAVLSSLGESFYSVADELIDSVPTIDYPPDAASGAAD